jgi:hypothetical protein
MKSVLLIICALGYGFLPGVAQFGYETLFTLFVPILLGLIYFVFHQHDWPPSPRPVVVRLRGDWEGRRLFVVQLKTRPRRACR